MSTLQKKKTVFFDRDGTLIVNQHYLNDPELIVYLPGAFAALALLRDAGFQFVMVTNQSGIAKGIVSEENMHEIHRRMVEKFREHRIEFAGIYFSPHASDSNHEMRKPNPGMLLQADRDLGVDFSKSWMVGDNISDVEAGHRAGCRSVYLETSGPLKASAGIKPDVQAPDLLTAANQMLKV
jgi:D-glycero-D-manno-heptose 1,7-bisphosphate phosphatase